jgi:hypothetical protein
MTDAAADTDKEGVTSSTRLFSALVEVGRDGWATVWVGELLGLFVNESSEDEALRQIPGAIVAYLQWLRRHGEDIKAPEAAMVAGAERQTPDLDLAYGEYAALFDRDRVPVTDDDLVQATRWMRYMRDDTLDLVARLPAAAMGWRRRPDHKYSIGDYLEHIARAERWYLTRLWPDVPLHVPGATVLRSLAQSRERALNWLLTMPVELRGRVVDFGGGDLWTARKVLGRYLYHERYHIRSIARIALEQSVEVPDGLGGWHTYEAAVR